MKPKFALILPALAVLTTSAQASSFTPITDFNPFTYFTPEHVGIDFNGPTAAQNQPGFAVFESTNDKTFNVTTGGITFDLNVTGVDVGDANVNRTRGDLARGGPLLNDFHQFFESSHAAGEGVRAKLTLTGLLPNTEYDTSFFFANFNGAGPGGTGTALLVDGAYRIYDGASITDPLITTFTPSGYFTGDVPTVNYTGFSPGITIGTNSGPTGTIVLTVRAGDDAATASRLTLNGISVIAIPEPSAALLGGLGLLALLRRRR